MTNTTKAIETAAFIFVAIGAFLGTLAIGSVLPIACNACGGTLFLTFAFLYWLGIKRETDNGS